MDMTLSLAAIAAFRRSFNYRPDWTQDQALHMYGSLAVALIIWKLVEVLLTKHAKKLDKKTCKSIGCCAALFIVMISVLFMP